MTCSLTPQFRCRDHRTPQSEWSKQGKECGWLSGSHHNCKLGTPECEKCLRSPSGSLGPLPVVILEFHVRAGFLCAGEREWRVGCGRDLPCALRGGSQPNPPPLLLAAVHSASLWSRTPRFQSRLLCTPALHSGQETLPPCKSGVRVAFLSGTGFI